jgi:4-amino-4-deoxy-L-arabinose transferase-like glycosyltransferase
MIVVAAIFMVAWSLAVPVFEAPDEPAHWQVARYVFDHQKLPLYDATMVEANQPPIYYLLIAPFARPSDEPTRATWIDGDDTMRQTFPPRWYLNTSQDLSRYRPIRVARLVTVFMGAIALVFVYLSAVEATASHRVGLLAVGLVGFLPQFSFRAGTISNDTLLVTFSAVATWLTIRIVRRGFSWWWGAAAAAAFGFAYLTKVNAICLGPPLALAILLDRVPLVQRLRHLAVFAVTALVVAPWSLRNIYLYGDAVASNAMTTAVAGLIHAKTITAPWLWTYFPYAVSRSFVGVFGWMNVWMPQWIYDAYWCLGTLAAIGLLTMLVRTRGRMPVEAVLLTVVILSVAVVVHINLSFDQPQGRYLFPALPAVGILIATGLASLPIGAVRPKLGALVIVLMVVLNSYVFARVIVPAYYPPPSLTESRAVVGVPRPQPYGLTPLDGSGELFRIANDDPQLTSPVAIDAQDLGVLQFEVEGSAAEPVVTGSVYFSTSDSPATEQQRVDFRWKADGTRRLISVPLGGHPGWRGQVTVVRIDPINEHVRQNRGAVVRVSRITLRGSL